MGVWLWIAKVVDKHPFSSFPSLIDQTLYMDSLIPRPFCRDGWKVGEQGYHMKCSSSCSCMCIHETQYNHSFPHVQVVVGLWVQLQAFQTGRAITM